MRLSTFVLSGKLSSLSHPSDYCSACRARNQENPSNCDAYLSGDASNASLEVSESIGALVSPVHSLFDTGCLLCNAAATEKDRLVYRIAYMSSVSTYTM